MGEEGQLKTLASGQLECLASGQLRCIGAESPYYAQLYFKARKDWSTLSEERNSQTSPPGGIEVIWGENEGPQPDGAMSLRKATVGDWEIRYWGSPGVSDTGWLDASIFGTALLDSGAFVADAVPPGWAGNPFVAASWFPFT